MPTYKLIWPSKSAVHMHQVAACSVGMSNRYLCAGKRLCVNWSSTFSISITLLYDLHLTLSFIDSKFSRNTKKLNFHWFTFC